METPSNRQLRGRWRRGLFWAWVGVSLVVSVYVAIVGPFAHYFGEGRSFVALVVPAVMVFMLVTGLGWLVLLVSSRRRREEN